MFRRSRVVLAALSILATSVPSEAALPKDAVDKWRQRHEREILSDYLKFLSLPNVASSMPDIERNAAFISAELQKRGFATRLLAAAPNTPPCVYAEMKVPGAKRTVLFYAHYDGQPINQKGWLSPPFQPAIRTRPPEPKDVDWQSGKEPIDPSWRVFGRSTSDDKATIQAMFSALDALRANKVKPSINIKLLYEGEEEHGSPHFGAIIRQNRDLLRADLMLAGDGPVYQNGQYLMGFGGRGLVGFTATVYGPKRPLHDGHYGSWAPSPTVMLADLIMSFRDEQGHIKIPGFYDDVIPLSDADRAALAALPDVETNLKKELALGRTVGPPRLADGYLTPTFNVRAIRAGDDPVQAANAIATDGMASFDIRLVGGEEPAHVRELVENYLTQQGWFVVHEQPDDKTRLSHGKVVLISWDKDSTTAFRSAVGSPTAMAAVRTAAATIGYTPLLMPTGGASSGLSEAVSQLKIPFTGIGIANYDNNQHSYNENIEIGYLWKGIDIYAGFIANLNW
jgi:acetylornithine deacetylase/succinyl-diaminopimelate desuccinylase-like protein